MDGSSREIHRLQLRTLQLTDPRRLFERYCHAVGDAVDSQLPRDISFRMMIEAILDHDEKRADPAATVQTGKQEFGPTVRPAF